MKAMNLRNILAVASFFLSVGGTAAAADGEIEIRHDAIDYVSLGKPIDVAATVNDPNDTIETVRTYFRTTLDDRFYFVAMDKHSDGTYSAVLPAPLRGSKWLEYVILAKSSSDQIVKTPHFAVEIADKETIARRD